MLADNAIRFRILGRVDVNRLYDEWRREPKATDYDEPRTGWQLRYAYVFSNDTGTLVFENRSQSGAYCYRILLYELSLGSVKLLKKVRFLEDEHPGQRLHAIAVDEDNEVLFVERSGDKEKTDIYCVSIDGSSTTNTICKDIDPTCIDWNRMAIVDNDVVLFVQLPLCYSLDEDDDNPQELVYIKPDPPAPKEDEDDTSCPAKPVALKSVQGKTAMEELQVLVGLHDLKRQTEQIVAFAKMQKLAAAKGRKLDAVNLNLVFSGNPGTAKTTAARIFARVMKENGIISKGDLLEVGRADLVAKYLGQTAIKVKDVFAKAKGNVLFIDEAYSLVDSCENEYGDEAIATIVQEMENKRDDLVVIFAGYPDKMQGFLSRNPGLRSRVPYTIEFKDYTAGELAEIAKMEVTRRGYTLDEAAEPVILEICRAAMQSEDFGNGRFSRNLVDSAIMNAALRVVDLPMDTTPEEDFFRLEAEDFVMPEHLTEKTNVIPIGFRVA